MTTGFASTVISFSRGVVSFPWGVVSFLPGVLSFSPGFSPVLDRKPQPETVSTVSRQIKCLSSGLKPGENEMAFEATL